MANCHPTVSLVFNTDDVSLCQLKATTPFCWPPNGTRLYLSSSQTIAFYWPTAYYNSDSELAIDHKTILEDLSMTKNIGYTSYIFTQGLYDARATSIPGKDNERSLIMYLLERRMNDNLRVHQGPTIILVDTAISSSSASRTQTVSQTRSDSSIGVPYPTWTSSDYDSNDDDSVRPQPQLAGVIIGIALGSCFAIILLVVLCCCGPCWFCRRLKRKPRINEGEQSRIGQIGTQLMEPSKIGSRAGPELQCSSSSRVEGSGYGFGRVDEERDRCSDEPPPYYTP
ncbi:hypothetical protein BKA66DRAFT_478761 [Pyrenochaeta sp. MPI-SDFR-AT-0127]|nr:hypothetical protein BKA66DRAFT_478761 [Pyrenochaeta sp. MPI-SDFR-AT-0127]